MQDKHREAILEESVIKLKNIIEMQQTRQQTVVRRVDMLYKISFIAFTVIVFSMSLLMIVMASQMPELTKSIGNMNTHFASITEDMEVMRHKMHIMQDSVSSLPPIIQGIDTMQSSTGDMSGNVAQMTNHMLRINQNLSQLSHSVTDMQQSFKTVDNTVLDMRGDVQHLSQPIRLFNTMNPFW